MSRILLSEGAAAATPGTGKVALYAKADGFLYSKDDTGAESQVSFEATRVYGIMSAQANATPESTVDATPRKLAAWNTDGVSHLATVDSTTNDNITVNAAGIFLITANISFSGDASKTYLCEIYKNASPTGFRLERKLGAGGDIGSASVNGVVSAVATDAFSIYQWSSDGGTTLLVTEAQLIIHGI